MANKDYKALKEAIMAKAKEGMKKDVLDYVRKEMSQAVEDRVYNVYPNPLNYVRRRENDGLQDKRNMIGMVLGERSLGFDFEVHNATKTNFSGKPRTYLAPIVIMGQDRARSNGVDEQYLYSNSHAPYAQPRDFIRGTKEQMNRQTLANKLESYMNRG